MKTTILFLSIIFLFPVRLSVASEKSDWNKQAEFWFQKYKKLRECVEEKVVGGNYQDIEIECLIMDDEKIHS